MSLSKLPNLGTDFRFGSGKAGSRGFSWQLSKMASRAHGNVKYRNLSEKNVKTVEGLLKPYRRSLKGINRMAPDASTPGLTRKEAIKVKRKAWSLYKKDRYTHQENPKDHFTKEDLKDFKEIVTGLTREEQKKIKQDKKPKIFVRRPYLEDEQSANGFVGISGMQKSKKIDTGIAHGTISIGQITSGKRPEASVSAFKKPSFNTPTMPLKPSMPKPINRNFGLKV